VQRFKKPPSPPMVVACLALLLAASGTGYAALKLPKNSVTTVQVKDGTLLARDFKAGQLPSGGGTTTGATVRWVEVLSGGVIAGQSGGITVRHVGNGYYVVDFGVDVSGKAILASSARTGDDRTGRGVVAAGPCTTTSQAGDNCVTGNDARFVAVYTYDGPGSQPENHAFYVAVIG
jgi:hypothetical protein